MLQIPYSSQELYFQNNCAWLVFTFCMEYLMTAVRGVN